MDTLSNLEVILSVIVSITVLYPIVNRFCINKMEKANKSKISANKETVASRFVQLFEAHGVHRNQIPIFFGRGLSFECCSDDETLLKHLTVDMINDAAELFGVNVDWLHGTNSQVFPVYNFYKQPDKCKEFIDNLVKDDRELSGCVLVPSDTSGDWPCDTAIVITEKIGEIAGRDINRIYLLGRWVYHYWRSRGYLVACASIALNHGIWLVGKTTQSKWLSRFSSGAVLPEYDFELTDFTFESGYLWYVDEMIEQPCKYLVGVDPEHENFGLRAAINLWLELNAKGYMRIEKYGGLEQIRRSFETFDVNKYKRKKFFGT